MRLVTELIPAIKAATITQRSASPVRKIVPPVEKSKLVAFSNSVALSE
jgi:hypothetical protein